MLCFKLNQKACPLAALSDTIIKPNIIILPTNQPEIFKQSIQHNMPKNVPVENDYYHFKRCENNPRQFLSERNNQISSCCMFIFRSLNTLLLN